MTNQITEVRLLSVPLGKDYKHTLYFDSQRDQKEYFTAHTKHVISESSYQRKDGYIRFPKYIEEIKDCNYLMFSNPANLSGAFLGKTYYAFITDMVYKSDEVTWIYYEVDVLQTYMFDYQIKPSFVEREHCADDTFGLHTVPENLECGEFVCRYRDSVTELQDAAIVMGVTEDIDGEWDITNLFTGVFEPVSGQRYDGIYSGVKYKAVTNSARGIQTLNYQIVAYAGDGKNDAIKCLFMYPLNLISYDGDLDSTMDVLGAEKPKTISKTFYRHNSNEGEGAYEPKNNKVNCFPYRYLLVSNNNGGSAVYHFEDFDSDAMTFKIRGCITPGGSIRLIPMDYKGLIENEDEGLNLGKYPICNWSSDEFTNWLTQNSVNVALNIVSGAGQIVGGLAIGAGSGGLAAGVGGGVIAGGVSTIAGQLAQIHQMSFASPQSRGNINCGDVVAAANTNTFYFQSMTIKEEYMRIIDNFFDMFGYKTNRVKVPETNHRENYWYTKTIDVNIVQKDGRSVSQGDLDKIKECYNRGVTFWRTGANVGNYELSNKCLTEV